ncbi:MAG: hypothetical protein ACOYM3_03510 [Terrimicrobiaceae bacterium]
MARPQPATRVRTCRACGTKFEYPLKGDASTRHHCAECAAIPAPLRKVNERLLLRIQKLELDVSRLKLAAARPPIVPPEPAVVVPDTYET